MAAELLAAADLELIDTSAAQDAQVDRRGRTNIGGGDEQWSNLLTCGRSSTTP
ncbi:hypothetical protein [Kribbella sindirgiensis]|uniref:hypothetical protein n=1 Tax=Kribbella sindirgiensis TaxID=1124744 RepID=UPI0013F4A53C|nr:hypothetical protein [Kribbella sindirgiensis]